MCSITSPLPSLSLELILRRSLGDIEKQSQGLLTKGKVARILDKTQDSGTVVKLIEQLRQAILVYQVCHSPAFCIEIAGLSLRFGDSYRNNGL